MTTNEIHPPRAYRDPEFMNSPEARPVRILAEYLEPQERFEEFNIKHCGYMIRSDSWMANSQSLVKLWLGGLLITSWV